MDIIHFREEKIVRGKEVTFLFFNSLQKDMFNPEYEQLIKDAPVRQIDRFVEKHYLVDTHGNQYRLKQSAILQPTAINSKITLKEENHSYFFFKSHKINFMINNSLPTDTKLTKDFIKTHLSKLDIMVKVVNEPRVYWNVRTIINQEFFAIALIDNQIVAKISCQTLDDTEMEEYFRDKETMFPKMNLYISDVDVRPDFQGQGLCKPITSYMIKHLKRLGFDMLFIENASDTRGGVPACICYYKAGIENNYNMRYKDHHDKLKPFKKMHMSDCFRPIDELPSTYYYVSDKYNQSGKEKLKRVVHYLGTI